MDQKWSGGKIAGLIIGGLAALFIAFLSLAAGVYYLGTHYVLPFMESTEDISYDESLLEEEQEEDWDPEEKTDTDVEEYYEFEDDIKADLSYQVDKDVIEESEETGIAKMIAERPYVIMEDQVKEDRINGLIKKEMEKVREHIEQTAGKLSKENEFQMEVRSYITYMDEETLSIVLEEDGYLDNSFYESRLISLNFDMETGMAMTNTQILKIDDEFTIDFRERCEKQNGEIYGLNYYSDQDITSLMNEESTLILFYTPLGLEVGFNYPDGWVTVTYPDYEEDLATTF